MPKETIKSGIVSDAYLRLLADRGIDYMFVNGGTDFAPIIESFAKADVEGTKMPEPIIAPHENVAVSMAHGYYLVTGKPQAVMVHVNVGTANAICGVINAYRDRVPMLMTAGRTPLTETELPGSRSGSIHWAQEMFDQAGMLREVVKWDYELRNGEQVEAVVDRALEVAMAEPKGPVYLSLPREVLGYEIKDFQYETPSRRVTSSPAAPDLAAIEKVAEMLVNAERPLIITRTAGQNPLAVEKVAAIAEDYAIPVGEFRPVYNTLANSHAMNIGFDLHDYLGQADCIVTLDCDAPWLPEFHGQPAEDCHVIQIATDPLFQNYPIRGFARDLSIAADIGLALAALKEALAAKKDAMVDAIDSRRARLAERRDERLQRIEGVIGKVKSQTPLHQAWITRCLDEQIDDDALVFNDYPLLLPFMKERKPNTYFGTPLAGGLGFGVGAALGAKLGAPDKLVISAVGDGAYMFGNPVPAHQVAAAYDLPILFLVFNNSLWGAVKRSALGMYPDGFAAKSNKMPITQMEPSPEYDKIMDMFGGYGEKVENPEDVPGAIERALHAVQVEKRQALLHFVTGLAW